MLDKEKCRNDVEELCARVYTVWDNYDFSEKSMDPNQRVPSIVFRGPKDYELGEETVTHVGSFMKERFVRKCPVVYRDLTYIFSVEVHVYFGVTQRFGLAVYVLDGSNMEFIWEGRL